MSGWIKIHREINNHWIWKNPEYLKWWMDILLEVNYLPCKVVIKGSIYECGRGEKLYSLDTWASRWNTNKSKVRRFLNLLQSDSMIIVKSETQTTRITICNYDDYQDKEIKSETQMKHKRNADETHLTPIKEGKESKEREEEIYKPFNFFNSMIEYGFTKNLVDDWIMVRKKKNLTNTETAFKGFIKQIESTNQDKNNVLEQCVINSWGGFKAEWLKPEVKKDLTRTKDHSSYYEDANGKRISKLAF